MTHPQQKTTELTPRQEQIWNRLRSLPTPPVPRVDPGLLKNVPPWIRWVAGLKVVAVSLLLALGALFFHPMIPEILQGPFPLKAGSSLELLTGRIWKIPLPSARGWMVLEGPVSLQLIRAGRAVPSGRFEAEMVLKRGELFLHSHSDTPKVIFIRTPLVTVRVTGTDLLVGHTPEQGSRVLVMRGEVEVKSSPTSPWESLTQGLVLRATPQGTLSREPLDLKEGQSAQVNKDADLLLKSTASSEADFSQWTELWNVLWHEN